MAKKLPPKKERKPWKDKFLAAYAAGMTVAHAAKEAGVTRQWATKSRAKDEAFDAEWAEAEKESADNLEAEARRRATEGVQVKKFHNGQPVIDPETGKQYIEREYSDTLLIFLLKGRNPSVFGDKIDHTTGGKSVTFTLNLGNNKPTE